jgi:hypothetical protein
MPRLDSISYNLYLKFTQLSISQKSYFPVYEHTQNLSLIKSAPSLTVFLWRVPCINVSSNKL